MISIASGVKAAISAAEKIAKRHAIRTNARNVYRQISSDPALQANHRGLLTRVEKRAIRRYAARMFGSSRFAAWLYAYTIFRGEFVEGWIPDDFFGQDLLPMANRAYRTVAGARTLTRRFISADCIPDVAYRVHGIWFDTEYRVINEDDLRHTLFAAGNRSHVFLKADMTSRGRGVWLLSEEEFARVSIEPSLDLVAQEPIEQARWFAAIHPHGVATIRLTTAFTAKRKAHFRASYLRVGRGTSRFISKKFFRCPVVGETGELAPYAANEFWHRFECHPDTGYVFAHQRIPHFDDALQCCLDLHARVPHFMFIGWDVAVCEGGKVHVLEWNAIHPDISFSEASTGPNFADLRLSEL